MQVVETVARIRRAEFVQKKPITAICWELKLSWKVVRKVIRTEATQFEYERSVQSRPKIGSWQADLDHLLAETAIGLFKTKVIHRRGTWLGVGAVERATLASVDWFKNRRPLSSLGYGSQRRSKLSI